MGFNIGRFIGAIAPTVGGYIGGPIGGLIGEGVAAGFEEEKTVSAATTGRNTQPGPISTKVSPDRQFSGGPQVKPTSIVPTSESLAGRIGRIGKGPGELFLSPPGPGNGGGYRRSPVGNILAKARAATGGPVTRNKIIDAAKTCGLEMAANTFGLDVREVCQVVVKGRTRRRRGVSAADIRRTKRTIHFASKIRKDLKALAR